MSTEAHSEEFTPAEAAYFKSGGSDTTALEAEIASNGTGEPAGGDTAGAGNPAGAPAADAGSDPDGVDGEDGEEVVVLGKDGKPRSTNGRFVPHQALHKERERRKAVEERFARADERLAVLNDILGAAGDPAKPAAHSAPQPEASIDPEKDPLGALSQALNKIKTLESQLTEDKTRQGERENARAMQSAYQNDAVRYLQEKPEFKDAYQYLIEGRHRELEAMGMTDARQRNQFIANEERGIVSQAFQMRQSPSQMLHNLAAARGFKAAAPAPQHDPAKKIEQIAHGQKNAGASLSGAGGSSGEGLTAAALADMNEEEFAAIASKLGKSKLRQLMGG